jgi:adenosylcobyric acid synthase
VLPHWEDLRVPEEDSLGWDSQAPGRPCRDDTLVIGILDIPYLSNFTDLDALSREPDVRLIRVAEDTDRPFDALVIPGTKQTACGLQFVKKRGLDRLIHRVWRRGGTIVGLCGGYQMLGRLIRDPHGVESTNAELDGLGLLDAVTTFETTKVVRQVSGIHPTSGCPVEGYEIHMGRTVTACSAWLHVRTEDEPELRPEGAVSTDGRIVGTYVHGLFDAPQFRRHLLNQLRAVRGWPELDPTPGASLDGELDRLADFVAHHLDIGAIESIIERGI